MRADSTSDGSMRAPGPRELAQVLEAGNPVAIAAFAISGWAVILWMMLFKPF
jgi:hypothetical protein